MKEIEKIKKQAEKKLNDFAANLGRAAASATLVVDPSFKVTSASEVEAMLPTLSDGYRRARLRLLGSMSELDDPDLLEAHFWDVAFEIARENVAALKKIRNSSDS